MKIEDMPLGVDVSNWQGIIDWKKVAKAGIRFASIKATEDNTFLDPYFERNWKGAKDAGLYREAYHYTNIVDLSNPRPEADFFVHMVETHGGIDTGDLLSLDMEVETPQDLGSWTLYWLQIVESYVGFKPLLYTRRDLIKSLNLTTPGIEQYGLWLASITSKEPSLPIPPWGFVAFWQWTFKGQVPGINGDVDMDRFIGEASRIPLYGKLDVGKPEIPQPQPTIDVGKIREYLGLIANSRSNMTRTLKDIETLEQKIDELLG
jgi:lysozyme